jgi:hypothetical protein
VRWCGDGISCRWCISASVREAVVLDVCCPVFRLYRMFGSTSCCITTGLGVVSPPFCKARALHIAAELHVGSHVAGV